MTDSRRLPHAEDVTDTRGVAMAALIRDAEHVSSAEDMSELLDSPDADDDLVIVGTESGGLATVASINSELAGFEAISVEERPAEAFANGDGDTAAGTLPKIVTARGLKMPFRHPWTEYFRSFEDIFLRPSGSNGVVGSLKEHLLRGRMAASNPHRFVCWSALLKNLSADPKRWHEQAAKKRHEYEVYKTSYYADDRKNSALDPEVNNPLSQDANSPWSRYFADNDLKEQIDKVRVSYNNVRIMTKDCFDLKRIILGRRPNVSGARILQGSEDPGHDAHDAVHLRQAGHADWIQTRNARDSGHCDKSAAR